MDNGPDTRVRFADGISNKRFASYIRYLMDREDLSCVSMAELLGAADTTISTWRSGKKVASVTSATKICDIFGITMDELIKNCSGTEPAQATLPEAPEEAPATPMLNQDATVHVMAEFTRKEVDVMEKVIAILNVASLNGSHLILEDFIYSAAIEKAAAITASLKEATR